MYLECDYIQECFNNNKDTVLTKFGIERRCYPAFRYYIPLTDKNGNLTYYTFTNENGKNNSVIVNKGTDLKSATLDECWLTKFTSDNCSNNNTYNHGPANVFSEGVCPSGITKQKFGGAFIPFGKQGNKVSEDSIIDETEYVIYSFVKDNNRKIIAEGYTEEGKYCYAGSDIKMNFWNESNVNEMITNEISFYIYDKALNLGTDFWKVHNNFESRIIATESERINLNGMNVCAGLTEEECAKDLEDGGHNYEVIIDSKDSNNKIKQAVESWYKEVNENSNELGKLIEIINRDYFVETANDFNSTMNKGKKYTFSINYTKEQFINDLNDAYTVINSVYGEDKVIVDYNTGKGTSAQSSIVSYIYKYKLGISEIVEIAEKDDKEHHVNIKYILSAMERDVQEELENYIENNNQDINVLDVIENILEYMEKFYTAVVYLDKNSSEYSLNSSQVINVENLKRNYQNFVAENKLDFYPVIDCESLLGEELIEKINDYLNIFKIAIPILLIGFSILDFTKAIFASDEDKIKKTKTIFIKRIFISILIFLSPLLVNLILNIANKVWGFISPNACGLFK